MDRLPRELILSILAFSIGVPARKLGISSTQYLSTQYLSNGHVQPLREAWKEFYTVEVDLSVAVNLVLVCRDWQAFIEPEIYRRVCMGLYDHSRFLAFHKTITTSARELASKVLCIGFWHYALSEEDVKRFTEVYCYVDDLSRALVKLEGVQLHFYFSRPSRDMDPIHHFPRRNNTLRSLDLSARKGTLTMDDLFSILPPLLHLKDLTINYIAENDILQDTSSHVRLSYHLSRLRIGAIDPFLPVRTTLERLLGHTSALLESSSDQPLIHQILIEMFPHSLRTIAFNGSIRDHPDYSQFLNNLQSCQSFMRLYLEEVQVDPDQLELVLDDVLEQVLVPEEIVFLHPKWELGSRPWVHIFDWIKVHRHEERFSRLRSLLVVVDTRLKEELMWAPVFEKDSTGLELGYIVVDQGFYDM